MGADLKPYLVCQGDTLTKLAFLRGFNAGAVWADARNDELRKLRPDMDLLAPGDVVRLPDPQVTWLPLAAGATNRYVAKVPRVAVHLVLQDEDGGPLAAAPYLIRGLGDPVTGATGADGSVSFDVPVVVREVFLELPDRGVVYPVRVGDLDPPEEASGVRMRLAHLGYLRSATDGDGAALARAVAAFQTAAGLAATGAVDDATREALKKAHGS